MYNMSKQDEVRYRYAVETGGICTNSQGEPDIDYVSWLEVKVSNHKLQIRRVRRVGYWSGAIVSALVILIIYVINGG